MTESFGRQVAQLRHQRGMTQIELAERINRSTSWVSQVERGHRAVDRMSVRALLAEALEVPESELAGFGVVISKKQTIADVIEAKIVAGDLQPGDLLPTERELMVEYGVARGTARDAVLLLATRGLVYSVQGAGTFVAVPPPPERNTVLHVVVASQLTVEIRAEVARGVDRTELLDRLSHRLLAVVNEELQHPSPE